MSVRFHIGRERPPLTKEFASWLHSQTRVLAARLISQYLKKTLSRYLVKWHLKAVLEKTKYPRKSLAKFRSPVVLKLKMKGPRSPPQRAESKSGEGSPSNSVSKFNLSTTLKGIFHNKKSATESVTVSANSTSRPQTNSKPKRPSSLPPGRKEDLKAGEPTRLLEFGEGKGMTALQSVSSAMDFGTRLFRKAQELETKREALRKNMEPGYTFQPQLSQDPEKWLKQKSSKSTPVKARSDSEEIAIVSSTNALNSLSRIVEMISPTNQSASKLPRSRTVQSRNSSEEGQRVFFRETGGYNITAREPQEEVMVDVQGEDTDEVQP